ncbi:hypothetical protein ACFVQ4_07450 [Streptomyces laurentii]|uniref:hypothetical protein n=1 Tax=Streptomyces laurentii TaxID=39478 RepID=UPI0036CE4CB3
MRDLIALAAIGLGTLCVLVAIRATSVRRPGRHTAEFLADQPEPAPMSPWSRPWTSPTKAEAAEIFRKQAETTMRLQAVRERRTAAALATLGIDYPYDYPGDHFESLAALASAGVTA